VKPLRVPFEEAIADPALLKTRFEELSLPQQVALKVMYGCHLSPDIHDTIGWSELDYWAAMQEQGTIDELGYLTAVTPVPYIPQTYREAWFICGRRAGKSDAIAATIVAYEAALGGHEMRMRRGRKALCYQIAQDIKQAKYSLHSIRATLESMPVVKDKITNVTADTIDLWNGINIAVVPPTMKSVRGYDNPIATLDEVGVWYQDADSANPDFEVYRAVSPGQAQFPDAKIIGISSPWSKQGILFKRWQAGTNGSKLSCQKCRAHPDPSCRHCRKLRLPHQGRLVLHAPTAMMANPLITTRWLIEERHKDAKAFERECLARFQDSLSGFLSSALLQEAVERGVVERAPETSNVYVAALDPAFRRDAFAFCIGHADPARGLVIDLIRRWQPLPGLPLNPKEILTEIVPLLKAYKVPVITSDQYHFESLNQLAIELGFAIQATPFTATSKASIYGNLKNLVNTKRIRLLDHPEALAELSSLELQLTEGGNVKIAAPPDCHDDLATVIALVANQATWLLPAAAPKEEKEPTYQEIIARQVQRRRIHEVQPDADIW
jgi:hypothetical protein